MSCDFLDFTTLGLREAACREEVRLNRRLAPNVYLDVLPVTKNRRGRLKLGGNGTPVDWVVRMRRLPADRALDRLIEADALTENETSGLAAKLTEFYQQLPPVTIRVDDYGEQIEQHVRDNRRELLDAHRGLDASLVKRVNAAQLRFLRLRPDVLNDRVCDGRIVEGHGDLRPEHIYLNPTPTIIDCIEFNAGLRTLDVLDELGFLAMECDFLGAESVGKDTIRWYCWKSNDEPPPMLLYFYKSYRACVRAKVVSLRADQLDPAERQMSLARAERYLTLADTYAAELGPPVLLIVRGLMGVGKSTLARELASLLEIELLQTDAIRRDFFGASSKPCAYNEHQYQPEHRARVYEEMLHRADDLLRQADLPE